MKKKKKNTIFDSLFNKNKKSENEMTANQLTNVRDIVGSVLYSKDDYIFAYIKITPVILNIMSSQEKRSMSKSLTNELSAEKEPFALIKINEPIDISDVIIDYVGDLKKLNDGNSDRIRKQIIRNRIAHLSSEASSGTTLENLYYFILWERFSGNNEERLVKRANEFAYKLNLAGIESHVANEAEIKNLCTLFAYPNYAHKEDSNTNDSIVSIINYYSDGKE